MKNVIPVLRELISLWRNRNANTFKMVTGIVVTHSEQRWITEKEIPTWKGVGERFTEDMILTQDAGLRTNRSLPGREDSL